jgi:cytoskeletal protein CcmA (bactofilin family)
MFGRDSNHPGAVDILIGKTARIRGDIDFAGGLHLDGRVAGHVRADPDSASTLSVSETGWIEGSAQAGSVILNGTVRGDILAHGRVALGPRAKVHGDVYYGVIETALGAEILGRLVPVGERRSSTRGAGKVDAGAGERAAATEVAPAVGEVEAEVGEIAATDEAVPIAPVAPAGPPETA